MEEVMEESSSYSGPNLPSDWAGPACTILSPDEFEALSEPGVGSNAWVNDESGIGADSGGSEPETSDSEADLSGETSLDEDGDGNSDEDPVAVHCVRDTSYEAHKPSTMEAACKALADVKQLLKPPRLRGHGYKECRLLLALRTRMEWISDLLALYTNTNSRLSNGNNSSRWMALSLDCAETQQCGPYQARCLQRWVKAYIANCSALPISKNGIKSKSRINDDDVASEIAAHLQSLGPWI
jgi:hypothetical protein